MLKNIKLKKALLGASLGLLGVGAVVGSTVVYNNYVEQKENSFNGTDITVDGEGVNDGSILDYMPSNICFRRNSIKNSTVTFTATVLPENATNKTITWSLGWSSTGVSGKASDYVGLSVSADTHAVTLTCKKGFNNQIKLTGTTVDGISTSATIDMLKYVSAMTIKTDHGDVSISLDDNVSKIIDTSNKYDLTNFVGGNYSDIWDVCKSINTSITGTVGTVSIPTKYKLSLTSGIISYASSNGFMLNDGGNSTSLNIGFNELCDSFDGNCLIFCRDAIDDYGSRGGWLSKVTSYSGNACSVTLDFVSSYNSISQTQTIGYTFGVTGSYVDTTSISLNSSSIILK